MNQTQQSAAALRDVLLDLEQSAANTLQALFDLDLSIDTAARAESLRLAFISRCNQERRALMNLAHLADMLAEDFDEPEGQPAW